MDLFTIADKTFRSRLIVGTGKYSSPAVMVQAHEASGAEMITVAVRRVNISDRTKESLLDYIDTSKYILLPNTAGCYTADDAVRTARLGREAGLSNWVKLEVIGDERTLFPDNEALIKATRVLVREGFIVLPYTATIRSSAASSKTPARRRSCRSARRSGPGSASRTSTIIRIIREFARVPVIVDAGVGTASDAALAMELGADGVLMNTAIAGAQDPVAMAEAMKLAVRAGQACLPVGTHSAQVVREREQPGGRPGRTLALPKSPDDLEALKAERAAADRKYNDALTRLDGAIQRLPADFPQPPPVPDEHQVTPLNTLWKIDAPSSRGAAGPIVAAIRRVVAPLFEQQQAFNAAIVDHINREVPVARETRASIDSTLTVLHDTIAELVRFQSLLVEFLQQVTPFVDTRDRDVAGLLRGLAGAINGVADEMLKRSEATLVRDRRYEMRIEALEITIGTLRDELAALQRSGRHDA